MARFYSNENVPLPVVMELRRLGHDVLTSLDAGKANASIPDLEVLTFAASENRILLSHDRRHFLQLHRRRTTAHAGMVLITFDPDFVDLAQRIHEAATAVSDMRDEVIGVNRRSGGDDSESNAR